MTGPGVCPYKDALEAVTGWTLEFFEGRAKQERGPRRTEIWLEAAKILKNQMALNDPALATKPCPCSRQAEGTEAMAARLATLEAKIRYDARRLQAALRVLASRLVDVDPNHHLYGSGKAAGDDYSALARAVKLAAGGAA